MLNKYSTFTFYSCWNADRLNPKAPETWLSQKYSFELTKYLELCESILVLRPWGIWRKDADIKRYFQVFFLFILSQRKLRVKYAFHPAIPWICVSSKIHTLKSSPQGHKMRMGDFVNWWGHAGRYSPHE